MIDINDKFQEDMAEFTACEVVYQHPKSDTKLPCVSYYTLTERDMFSTDNTANIQHGTVAVDIWAKKPSLCGDISCSVNDMLTSKGWVREFSRDIPDEDVYHKAMRYSKDFNL